MGNSNRRPTEIRGARTSATEHGFKYRTFLDLIHRGEIPHLRIGRAIYVKTADVETWIEQHTAIGA